MNENNIPNNVIINEDTANRINVTQDAPNLVTVDSPNKVTVNQDSPNLIRVQVGSAATNTRRHVHTQTVASTEWIITHTLGGKPQVTVVDTGDNVVHGDVQYLSDTQLICSFSSAFAGLAYLT